MADPMTAGAAQVSALQAENERLRTDLDHWTSGRRRKGILAVESVPDGLHYAAELVRAQGTEGGDDHDQLLREAAVRLKALTDAAGHLLAEADQLRAAVDRARPVLDALLPLIAASRNSTAPRTPQYQAVIDAVDRYEENNYG